MTKKKRQALAKSMMAAKARGEMPCYDTALAYCEKSTFNDKAQAVFSRGTINKVLTTDCYDETPDRPWEFRYGAKRRPLTAKAKELRAEWAERILQEGIPGFKILSPIRPPEAPTQFIVEESTGGKGGPRRPIPFHMEGTATTMYLGTNNGRRRLRLQGNCVSVK